MSGVDADQHGGGRSRRGDGRALRGPRQWASLADEKLAKVDALIARAQAARELLAALRQCHCPTLEECVDLASRGA